MKIIETNHERLPPCGSELQREEFKTAIKLDKKKYVPFDLHCLLCYRKKLDR